MRLKNTLFVLTIFLSLTTLAGGRRHNEATIRNWQKLKIFIGHNYHQIHAQGNSILEVEEDRVRLKCVFSHVPPCIMTFYFAPNELIDDVTVSSESCFGSHDTEDGEAAGA